MPFPLAHPAAIFPLRRFCPKYLDLPSLIIGSLTPDLAASIDDWEYFSHTFVGLFVFCLPVGLFTFRLLYSLRTPLVSSFPNPHRDLLLPLCAGPKNRLLTIIISLVLAGAIHIAWDLFTHDHSWVVMHVAFFSRVVAGVRMNHWVWLLSSIAGSFFLFAKYGSLLRMHKTQGQGFSPREYRAYALWCGIFSVPLMGAIPLAFQYVKPVYSLSTLARPIAIYYEGLSYLTLAVSGFLLRERMIGSWRASPK
jgi:hypothetical protein